VNLNFSVLNDDQLVALIQASYAEAVRRGARVAVRAEEACRALDSLSNDERAAAERERRLEAQRLADQEAERARRRAESDRLRQAAAEQTRVWALKKEIADAIAATGYDVRGDQLVVWRKAGGTEKRVFLQQKHFGGTTYLTLFVTGNAKHAPGSIKNCGVSKKVAELVEPILRRVAAEWAELRINLDEAVRLKQTTGLAALFASREFSEAWEPGPSPTAPRGPATR
jgi:hypothetical protein